MTADFDRALTLMEKSHEHIFVTGRAGTGKSTLLHLFRERTRKNIAVLAPTGVAAVNVKGQTIHSFFGFRPDITFSKVKRVSEGSEIYARLETIVIDEISMVRADLVDCIDKFLRLNGPDRKRAFGGVQMIFIGDLYQLPPVVTSEEKNVFHAQYSSPYFFSASSFADAQVSLFEPEVQLQYIELGEIFRQTDHEFINILNAVRENTVDSVHLQKLNTRVQQNKLVTSIKKKEVKKKTDMHMYLTTTNAAAAIINERELANLQGDEYVFDGSVKGEFDSRSLPTEGRLKVKIGAQIMLLNNDVQGRWINGTVGKVKSVLYKKEVMTDAVIAELETGEEVEIFPYEWDMYNFFFDENSGKIESEAVGSFTQYPFRLAWAVTIHKAQGKTFEKVVLDLGRGTFSPGQLYVALSRCRTLEGLSLVKPVEKRHAFIDRNVVSFLKKYTELKK